MRNASDPGAAAACWKAALLRCLGEWPVFLHQWNCWGRATQPEPCTHDGQQHRRETKQLKSNRRCCLGSSKNPEVPRTYANLIPCEKLEMSDRICFFFQASTLVYEGIDVATSKGILGCVCSRSDGLANAAHVVWINYIYSRGTLPMPVIFSFKVKLAHLSILSCWALGFSTVKTQFIDQRRLRNRVNSHAKLACDDIFSRWTF